MTGGTTSAIRAEALKECIAGIDFAVSIYVAGFGYSMSIGKWKEIGYFQLSIGGLGATYDEREDEGSQRAELQR